MTLLVNHIENADNKNFYEEEDKKSGRFEGTYEELMKFLLRSFFFLSFTVMLTLAISSRIYLEADVSLTMDKSFSCRFDKNSQTKFCTTDSHCEIGDRL